MWQTRCTLISSSGLRPLRPALQCGKACRCGPAALLPRFCAQSSLCWRCRGQLCRGQLILACCGQPAAPQSGRAPAPARGWVTRSPVGRASGREHYPGVPCRRQRARDALLAHPLGCTRLSTPMHRHRPALVGRQVLLEQCPHTCAHPLQSASHYRHLHPSIAKCITFPSPVPTHCKCRSLKSIARRQRQWALCGATLRWPTTHCYRVRCA